MGKQFTDKAIAAAKPDEKRYYLREGRGFALRVMPSGLKTFIYIYELNKAKKYLPLGHYPACSLAKARMAFNEAYNMVKLGIDPQKEKKQVAEEEARIAREAAEVAEAAARDLEALNVYTFDNLLNNGIPEHFTPTTVEQLAAVWVVKYSRKHHCKHWQDTALSCIKLHLLPGMGAENLTAIRYSHAISLIDKVADAVPGSARNLNKFGRQIFNYALRREWVGFQPFLEITKSVPSIAPKEKERNLDDDEIIQAWQEISKGSISSEVKRALKTILVTAQRPGEVAQMHRDQIKDHWWTIPADVAKNGREHRVYLTDTALALIGNGEGCVFPSDRGDTPHVAENTLSQAINRGYVDAEGDVLKVIGSHHFRARKNAYFGMKPWTPHDLRRTARTNLARVGISDEIGDEVTNHKKRGMAGVYNKYKYDPQKQDALMKWEGLLLEILGEVAVL